MPLVYTRRFDANLTDPTWLKLVRTGAGVARRAGGLGGVSAPGEGITTLARRG